MFVWDDADIEVLCTRLLCREDFELCSLWSDTVLNAKCEEVGSVRKTKNDLLSEGFTEMILFSPLI